MLEELFRVDFPGTNFVLRTQCCNGTYFSYSCGMEIVNLKELVCLAKVKRSYTVTCKKWESFAYDLLINDRRALVKYGRTWIEDGLFPHAGKFCENLSNNWVGQNAGLPVQIVAEQSCGWKTL